MSDLFNEHGDVLSDDQYLVPVDENGNEIEESHEQPEEVVKPVRKAREEREEDYLGDEEPEQEEEPQPKRPSRRERREQYKNTNVVTKEDFNGLNAKLEALLNARQAPQDAPRENLSSLDEVVVTEADVSTYGSYEAAHHALNRANELAKKMFDKQKADYDSRFERLSRNAEQEKDRLFDDSMRATHPVMKALIDMPNSDEAGDFQYWLSSTENGYGDKMSAIFQDAAQSRNAKKMARIISDYEADTQQAPKSPSNVKRQEALRDVTVSSRQTANSPRTNSTASKRSQIEALFHNGDLDPMEYHEAISRLK